MAYKPIQLPANWQVNAISWAARKAGMSYGIYKETILRQDPKMVSRIEEEYKAFYFGMKRAERERIAAAKKAAAARKNSEADVVSSGA